jgi:hypothetical protein
VKKGIRWWAAISGGLMAIGGFGAWATVFVIAVNGTQGDGWFPIVAGVGGAALAYVARGSRWAGIWTFIAGVVGLAVTAYDLNHLENIIHRGGTFGQGVIHVGWGLVLALLASISMALAGLVGLVQGPADVAAPIAPTDATVPASPSGKICPDCAEEVQQAARVCRFCGHKFPEAPAAEESEGRPLLRLHRRPVRRLR